MSVSAATSVYYFFLNEYGLNGPNTKDGYKRNWKWFVNNEFTQMITTQNYESWDQNTWFI
jgi:hypothetical protein